MSTPTHSAGGRGSSACVSLNAATANGSGKPLGGGRAWNTWGMQVVLGGTVAPTTGTISLQLSNDGTNWSPTAAATFTIGTSVDKDFVWAADKPAVYARATLAGLAGGTAPTVTATIVAV